MKSIGEALDLRSEILQELEKAIVTRNGGRRESTLQFVIVGGGPTGVELAGALAEIQRNVLPTDYTEIDRKQMKVVLIEAADRLLATMVKSHRRQPKLPGKTGCGSALDTWYRITMGHQVCCSWPMAVPCARGTSSGQPV